MPGERQETREIGGREVTVKSLKMGPGRELLVRIFGVAFPAIADALRGGADMRALAGGARLSAVIGTLLGGVGGRLDNALVDHVAHTLGAVSTAKLDGAQLSLATEVMRDTVFDGDYMAFFEWLAFALEVQYRDFFGGLQARTKAAMGAKAPSP